MTEQAVRAINRADIDSIALSPPDDIHAGRADDAMLRLIYDGLLTPQELSELTWADISMGPRGGAAVVSLPDHTGERVDRTLRQATVTALRWLRGNALPTDPVIDLSAADIDRRVQAAAKRAGLGDDLGAVSVRAGAAGDMARSGASFAEIMCAARGYAPVMPGQGMMNI